MENEPKAGTRVEEEDDDESEMEKIVPTADEDLLPPRATRPTAPPDLTAASTISNVKPFVVPFKIWPWVAGGVSALLLGIFFWRRK